MKPNTDSVARPLDDALERDFERSFKMAKAMAPVLDTIMDAHARAVPTYHRHTCPCGDWYLCHQEPDKCDTDYTCPSCLERQMDEYWQQPNRT